MKNFRKDQLNSLIHESLLSKEPTTTFGSWVMLGWIGCILTWIYHGAFEFTDFDNGIYIGIPIFIGFSITGIVRAIRYRNNPI